MPKRSAKKTDLPFRKIAQFWNWLPAFRAVAEAGGVNEAARLLRISPSALSRSVSLLEAALGTTLFFREKGLMRLTPSGEELLAATRDAMRLLHEASSGDSEPRGLVRIGVTSRLGTYRALPLLTAVRRRWPRLEPQVITTREGEYPSMLLRGQLDLVIAIGRPGKRLDGAGHKLGSVSLRPAECHVFCGKGHPLFDDKNPTLAKVLQHAFAAPIPSPQTNASVEDDSWPTEHPRTVAMASDAIEPAIDAAVSGQLLVCLPDEIVKALRLERLLRRLDEPKLPSSQLTCFHRAKLEQRERPTLVDELIAILHEAPSPRRSA